MKKQSAIHVCGLYIKLYNKLKDIYLWVKQDSLKKFFIFENLLLFTQAGIECLFFSRNVMEQ
jgi:hypothetical protein